MNDKFEPLGYATIFNEGESHWVIDVKYKEKKIKERKEFCDNFSEEEAKHLYEYWRKHILELVILKQISLYEAKEIICDNDYNNYEYYEVVESEDFLSFTYAEAMFELITKWLDYHKWDDDKVAASKKVQESKERK